MAFNEDLRLLHNRGHRKLDLQTPTPATENYQQSCFRQPSISEDTPSFYDAQYPWYTNQLYHDPDMLLPAHVAHIQMPRNLGVWNPSDVKVVPELLSAPCSPTVVDERHGNNYMTSGSYSAYDPGQNAIHWDSNTVSDLSGTSWPTSPHPQLLFDQGVDTLHHQPSACPSHACSSHATPSHDPCSELSIPHCSLPYQSFNPPSLQPGPHPTSTGFLETDPRCRLAFYRVPHQNSTGSSRRRRVARAIKYDELWIDEEELFKGLTEPDGKLTIHSCRWEEDHSPCHLWITGDKSRINAHIQKWHGGKPGGDKLQVDCHWSACGKTMLKESIARHIVTIHLGEMWECQGCGKEIVRNDAYGRHVAESDFDACRTSGALITYSAEAREIDARAALESRGRVRCAGA